MAILILIAVLVSGALFALGFALFDKGDDMNRRLAELERVSGGGASPSRTKLVRSLVDEKERVLLSARFAAAGWYDANVVSFTLTRVGLGFGGAALGVIAAGLLHAPLMILAVTAAGLGVAGFIAPSFALDSATKKRKAAIGQRLPDFLDMVSTTVEAGTALNGALAIAVSRMQGPLADEFRMTLTDIRVGMARSDAFMAMSRRADQPDLSSLVTALVQTERLGGNIASVLDELAEEARSRRLGRAEESAAKIPVKMVVPMAFLMIPALLVMIFGPVAAELFGK